MDHNKHGGLPQNEEKDRLSFEKQKVDFATYFFE